jgi:hypothetical protein
MGMGRRGNSRPARSFSGGPHLLPSLEPMARPHPQGRAPRPSAGPHHPPAQCSPDGGRDRLQLSGRLFLFFRAFPCFEPLAIECRFAIDGGTDVGSPGTEEFRLTVWLDPGVLYHEHNAFFCRLDSRHLAGLA